MSLSTIKLVALDLDGTLFDNESRVSAGNREALQAITRRGVHAVISTGRPFYGIPFDQVKDCGIQYAITANGSAIYEFPSGKCLYENCMEQSLILPILSFLLSKDIHMDAFIEGRGYSPLSCVKAAQKLNAPPALKKYILETRTRVEDLPAFIIENHLQVQKMTLNFFADENGVYKDRNEVKDYLMSNPDVVCVSGGYNNLEFTKAGVNKGIGLSRLAKHLGISIGHTMAIGDTENDMAILEAAGLGVAMGNATPAVKAAADDVTLSNEQDGVAAALVKYCGI